MESLRRGLSSKLSTGSKTGDDKPTSTIGNGRGSIAHVAPWTQSPQGGIIVASHSPALQSRFMIGTSTTITANNSTASLTLQRPKTAGAEQQKSATAKRNWAEILPSGSPIEFSTEHDTFHFPTPNRRPSTATASPGTSPQLSNQHQEGHLVPPDSAAIGIALGSPNHQQQQYYYYPSPSVPSTVNSTPSAMSPSRPARAYTTREAANPAMDGAKPKLSRWKSLGGLFGKRRVQQFDAPLRKGSNATLVEGSAASPMAEVDERGVSSATFAPASVDGETTPGSGSLLRRVTTKKVVASGLGSKVRRSPDMPTREAPRPPVLTEDMVDSPMSVGPLLDVDIPKVRMERYSVFFQDVQMLPARSSSLLARRQASVDKTKPVPGGFLTTLDIPGPNRGLVRRATDPIPVSSSPSYKLFPGAQTPKKESKMPHISTLHRPRPIKRTKTAPSSLSTPNPHEQKLSPAFEADEMSPGDDDRNDPTPTPSTPSSPTTPTSLPRQTGRSSPEVVKASPERRRREPSWEMITVGKRLSADDFNLFPSATGDRPVVGIPTHAGERPGVVEGDEDWYAPEPAQVAVARSLSVTRAGPRKQLTVRPVRTTSRGVGVEGVGTLKPLPLKPAPLVIAKKAARQASNVGNGAKVVSTREEKPAVRIVETKGSSRRVKGVPSVPAVPTLVVTDSHQNPKSELRKEIWGARTEIKNGDLKENVALTPRMCVVGDEENRKSVWGLIETV